jgi:hypothetical protein
MYQRDSRRRIAADVVPSAAAPPGRSTGSACDSSVPAITDTDR